MPLSTLLLVPFVLLLVTGPGFVVVRRLRWSPLEKLTGAVAASILWLALAVFAVYSAGLPQSWYYGITACSLALIAVGGGDFLRLLGSGRLRRTLAAFALLVLWSVGALALIRHSSGGDWCCDWLEHYQRSRFFLERWPLDFRFIDRYPLTTRPPLMNLAAAYVLGHTGSQFPVFQVTFTLLNILVFFPCCLFATRFAPRVRQTPYLVAAALAFNPMFFMNTTFAWTKVLTAFYVLLGLWLYLAGWRKHDPVRLSAAFLSLAASLLVHFSSLPFVIFLAGAYLVTIWPSQARKIQHLLLVAAPGALLGVAWMLWQIAKFGVSTTFTANATMEGVGQSGWWGNVVRIASNTFHTFWPYLFPGRPEHTPLRLWTDRAFTFYQENLLGAVGSVLAYVVLALLLRELVWRPVLPRREILFWRLFIPFTLFVGIAIDGETTLSGFANICLQPLVYLAVTFAAALFLTLRRPVRLLTWAGLLVDLVLGVGLELYMESQWADWAHTPNFDIKTRERLEYLGDLTQAWVVPLWLLLGGLAVVAVWQGLRLAVGGSPAAARG